MKTMKRLLASLVAVMLMASMLVVPVSAAGSYSISISDSIETNSYAAYQIFGGDLKIETDGTAILSNIRWADETEGADILAALQAATFPVAGAAFSSVTTAKGVADVLVDWNYNEADIRHFADVVAGVVTKGTADGTSVYNSTDKNHKISGLEAGYYLVLTTDVATGAFGYTDYLLKVTSNLSIAPKVSLPTLTKTVGNTLNGTYSNGADFQVGASESTNGSNVVYFKLEGTLPTEYDNYHQYHYKMTDVIDTSIFAVNEADFVQEIYRQHGDGTKTYVDPAKVSEYVKWDAPTKTLTVDFGDLKDHPTPLNQVDHVVVKFKVSLIGNPIIGKGSDDGLGNVNTATLYYSNDPNQPADAGQPGKEAVRYGSTTDDASVYTYGIQIKKVDAGNNTTPLPEADFKLSRNITTTNAGVETTTTYYAVVVQDNPGIAKYRVQRWTADANAAGLTMTTDENGLITVTGLDAVQYHLTETRAPSGYNQLTEPVAVTIQAKVDAASGDLTSLGGIADSKDGVGHVNTGIVEFNVVNNKGATLPETGGMGTTLFYVAGGALMVGAAAVLLTRKRSQA